MAVQAHVLLIFIGHKWNIRDILVIVDVENDPVIGYRKPCIITGFDHQEPFIEGIALIIVFFWADGLRSLPDELVIHPVIQLVFFFISKQRVYNGGIITSL